MEDKQVLFSKNKPQETLCVKCECSSLEHTVHFEYQPPSYTLKDFGEVYLHVYLNPKANNVWQRLKIAAKYVLGHQSKYGAWDESIIRSKAPQLIDLFQRMIKDNEDYADWLVSQKSKPVGTSNEED